MKKPLKILAIVTGVVVALLVIVIILATIFINPNRYRDDIVQAVKTNTGRDLKIDGDLRLSFFPWLGLETGRLQLSNAQGFGPEPFARVDSAGVKVKLLPLFRKEVQVDAIRLKGLRLNLARDASGKSNWENMARSSPEKAPEQKPKSPDAGAGLAVFTVNHVEIRDAEFTWNDKMAGASYALRRVEMTSGNLLGSSPAPLHLEFDLESGKPKITRRVTLDSKLNVDPAAEVLNMPELRLSVGDLKLNAQLHGTNIMSAPALKGRVDIPAFNLRALLQELQIPYAPADANALKKFGLTAQLDSDAKAMSVSDLRLALDETTLAGKLTIQKQPRSHYGIDLAIDNIDIDRYMPPASKDQPADKKENAKAVVIPLALLRETDADGQLRIQKLKAFGIRSEQIVLKVAARGGRITLGPNEAKLYSGTYAGRTVLDASGATPRFQFDEKLSNVQLGPLLKDADVFANYTGTGNIDLKLTAQGFDAAQITRTLNGTTAIAFRDGKIQGVNLQKIVQQARSMIAQARGREVQTTAQSGDETAFKSLTATIRVTDGVARNDDLKLDGPVVRAAGSGNANLVQQTLDYRMQVTLAEGTDRSGTTIPVKIGGTFEKPSYGVDISALLKEQTKPLEQKLEKKLGDRLREKLKR